MPRHWLLKAEPESRLVKGVDGAFSVDLFEKVHTSPREGVRNYQARNFLRDDMKVGDAVLFYHSNCALPGIVALAHVCKEGYPDSTAWDAHHPYYDAKSHPDAPRWYMVDVAFERRLTHPVPLALLQHMTRALTESQRQDVSYLTQEHLEALSHMALLHRSRLSVQPVDPMAYEAILLLGDRGGFEHWPGKWAPTAPPPPKRRRRALTAGAP